MNKEKKIEYIFNTINNKNKNNHFYFFIQLNNINYNKNKNGIFINLSILNEKIITKLYNYIQNDLNIILDDNYKNIKNKKNIKNTNIYNKNKNNIKKVEILNNNKNNISDIDKQIINLSKTI